MVAGWFLSAMILNSGLTIATAGRIWWLSRRINPISGVERSRVYRRTSAILYVFHVPFSLLCSTDGHFLQYGDRRNLLCGIDFDDVLSKDEVGSTRPLVCRTDKLID